MNMKSIVLAGALVASGLIVAGCEEGYPHNEQSMTSIDVLKGGDGTYGGSNSTYDTGNSLSGGRTTSGTANGSAGNGTGGNSNAAGSGAMGGGAASGSNSTTNSTSTTGPNTGG